MQYKVSRFSVGLLSTSAAAGIILAASPAFAQDAASFDQADAVEQSSKEIVVVGVTKQASRVQETPISITAFSGSDLINQGVLITKEIAAFTPGFSVRDAGNNPTAFILTMRGQVQNDTIATLDPSVGVYMDEFYIARAYGLNANLLDLESAQILKGPQGTLFGRNTSAGAILFTTADPKFNEVSGRVETMYGRFNEHQLTGIVNIGGDKVAVRGALFYANRDGYQTDVITGQKWGDYRTINGRLKLAYRPTDNLTIQLSGEQWDSKIAGRVNQNLYFNLGGTGFDPAAADRALFAGNPDRVAVTDPLAVPGTPAEGPNTNTFTETYTAKFILATDFGEVRLINGFRRVKSNSLLDLDGGSSPQFYMWTEAINDLKQWSSELQITGAAFDDKLSFALGGIYFGESGFDTSLTNAPNPPPGPSPIWTQFRGDIDNTSVGLYAQGSYALTDRLNFTAGLRWTHDRKGVTVQTAVRPLRAAPVACLPLAFTGDNNGDGVFTLDDCDRSRSDSWSNLSYTVGLDFKVSDDVMVYVKQSTGFRAGAQQLRSLTLADTAPAEPELVSEQEIGIKTQFWDRRITFNLAGYHQDIKDAQRSVILNVGGVSQTVLENASIENWGFEADFNVRLLDGFDVFGSYAYTKPKYTEYNGFVVVGGVLTPFDKSDYRFNSVINDQFTVGANYAGDLNFARLNINASYAWQGQMFQVPEPLSVLTTPTALGGNGLPNATEGAAVIEAGRTPSFGITNARLALTFGENDNYEIALWGRNIFDVRAKQYVLYLGGFNYIAAAWNDPATYGIAATVRF
jgi:iron complex outermembrane recepter protein